MSQDPGDTFDELAGELRQGAGREWRDEAAEIEAETHVWRLRRRTLGEIGQEALHRGDRLTVICGERSAAGEVVGAGTDYVTLASDALWVDVRLDAVVIRREPSVSGGVEQITGSTTWIARLKEFEQTGEDLELWVPAARQGLHGRIETVAADHLVVTDRLGGSAYVPVGLAAMVIRQRPPRRH